MTEYSSKDDQKGVENAFTEMAMFTTTGQAMIHHAIQEGVKEAVSERLELGGLMVSVWFKDAVENAVLQYLRENPNALKGTR